MFLEVFSASNEIMHFDDYLKKKKKLSKQSFLRACNSSCCTFFTDGIFSWILHSFCLYLYFFLYCMLLYMANGSV